MFIEPFQYYKSIFKNAREKCMGGKKVKDRAVIPLSFLNSRFGGGEALPRHPDEKGLPSPRHPGALPWLYCAVRHR
jgi:hypothetical protein